MLALNVAVYCLHCIHDYIYEEKFAGVIILPYSSHGLRYQRSEDVKMTPCCLSYNHCEFGCLRYVKVGRNPQGHTYDSLSHVYSCVLNMSNKKFNVPLKGFRGAGLGVQLIGAAAVLGYGITHSIYTGGKKYVRVSKSSRDCFSASSLQ